MEGHGWKAIDGWVPMETYMHEHIETLHKDQHTWIDYNIGNGCIKTESYLNGIIRSVAWTDENGDLHRDDDSPAYIKYDYCDNENKEHCFFARTLQWFKHGRLHRDNGPADISYFDHKQTIFQESWYRNGHSHRIGGPSYCQYDDDGTLLFEYWKQNGEAHRLDGPAQIDYEFDKILWAVNDEKIKNPPDHWPLTLEEQIEFKLRYA